MHRRSANTGDGQATLNSRFWDRPLPARIAGLTILIGSALLLLGGAYREQASLIRSALLLLALGAVLLPGAFRKTMSMKVAFFAVATIGVLYAVAT